jgi:hypothetical protein
MDTVILCGCMAVIVLICWGFRMGIDAFGRWLWSKKK